MGEKLKPFFYKLGQKRPQNGREGGKEGTKNEAIPNANSWIPDFTANDHQVPFANFGSITFTNAIAKGDKGSVSPQGAEIYAIREENAQSALTSCGARRGQVSCHYV